MLFRSKNYTVEFGDDGYQGWYKNNDVEDVEGFLHRDNDLPAIIYGGGTTQVWYVENQQHRENDQPAFISPCVRSWFYLGKIHRKNAPAYICDDNNEPCERWFVDGVLIDPPNLL